MDEHIVALNYLSETLGKISRSRSWAESLDNLFEFALRLLENSMMIVYTVDESANELKVVATRGTPTDNVLKRQRFKVGEGVVGWVAKHKKAVVLEDATLDKMFKVRQCSGEDPVIRSFMAVPMIYEDRIHGVISISHSCPGLYKKKDVQMMSIIASQLAAIYKIETILRDKTRFSNHILESINSGVLVINPDGEVILFNKAAEEITGYRIDEVLGMDIGRIPLKRSHEDWYILKTLKTSKHFFEKETYLLAKDGRELPVIVSTSVFYDETGGFSGVTAIFRDISEIKRLEQEMARADKLAALGKLTAGLAHEIRNPLLPIRTAASYLASKMHPDDDNYRLIKIIEKEGERLNDILKNFTDIARPERLKLEPVDLNALVLEVMHLLEHELKSHRIECSFKLSNMPLMPECNAHGLKQVLINLVLNAVDSMPGGGRIGITTTAGPGCAVLCIEDSGCGITPEIKHRIFDQFFTTKPGGTGLGLFIARNIIASFGGALEVGDSNAGGTAFKISIPVTGEGGALRERQASARR